MQLSDTLLTRRECTKDEAIYRGDSSVEDVVENIHPMHPVFIDSSIPEELHHDEELGELGDLGEKDEADVEAKRPVIALELPTFRELASDIPDCPN